MNKIERIYTVPSYYKDFACKGGSCRHTCCEGLKIGITREDYFRLSTLDCSRELRNRLDDAMQPVKLPDADHFAVLEPDFRGKCRMLGEDGLCSLQVQCGSDALSAICRYFPRRPRRDGFPECSTANSCEATLELLHREGFGDLSTRQRLSFDLADQGEKTNELTRGKTALHRSMVMLIARTALPLNLRMERMGEILAQAAPMIAAGDGRGVLSLAADCDGQAVDTQVRWKHTEAFFQRIRRLLQRCRELYPDMDGCIARALEETEAGWTHQKAVMTLSAIRVADPGFDCFLASVLANDLFCRYYPFSEEGVGVLDAYSVFRHMVEMLRLLVLTNVRPGRPEEMIDLFAAFFRMVEQSDFERVILAALSRDNPNGNDHDSGHPRDEAV